MIEFINVTKVYPHMKTPSLDGINLRVERGEFVFLVGPSGAGKSTLMKLIYREELPTTGQILVDGKDVARLPRRAVPYLRRSIGIIFQDFKLLPDRTVFENVAFALECTDVPRREVNRRVPAALELVGLRHKSRALAAELSGGEQQRVAVARAIVRNPVLVIADEPTGNLDPENTWAIMNLLNQINQMGATVVVATHAAEIVDTMKKRVIALERGRVVRDENRGTYGYES
ncbi:cell division ATP-binding protein FtsE [Symbiobacterium thermophilum]|uniref:Cell division ATP-binding protein FtsE n=1 Tax=Symbiobacterium thermophilum (strain DSM 24528 / JCM 14929 / IAM 14863 / T) TaxID=292459 RepID=Q67T69_SYMTH|nr:cell division ATP-binding protein FtsE [Symbiobacterium thermophilum]BAD39124.1 cell-division ATP-binding protein [Symbiobacterium thermophilum IAM 14863]